MTHAKATTNFANTPSPQPANLPQPGVIINQQRREPLRVVAVEVEFLGGVVDVAVVPDDLIGREALLASGQGALQRRFEAAVDPDREVVIGLEGPLRG